MSRPWRPPPRSRSWPREKLGYVRPGETAYVVLDPPGTPDETETAPPAPVEEKTWVDEVWEFLSGADLGS